MNITGIEYRFMIFTKTMDHTSTAEIPFSGNDLVLTETIRDTYETTIKKFSLHEETVEQFRALIDEYGITDWIGKDPAAPEVYDDDNTHTISFLTLILEDGSRSDITFRETDEKTGKEAAEAFRKLFFASAQDSEKISEEKIYPNLKEARSIKEEHGPVVAVETGSYTSGMMMGSNEWYTQTIDRIEGRPGTVKVTIKVKRGNGPEVTDSKETESDILAKVQEISDKENIPSWNYVCIDPSIPVDTSMIPTDYTSNGWLNIYYDDSLITGCPRTKRTIGKSACELGGKEVDRALTQMVNECVKASGAKVELSNVNPYLNPNPAADPTSMTGFIGMGMMTGAGAGFGALSPETPAATSAGTDGPWDCTCGNKGNTGKFCSECGQKRP